MLYHIGPSVLYKFFIRFLKRPGRTGIKSPLPIIRGSFEFWWWWGCHVNRLWTVHFFAPRRHIDVNWLLFSRFAWIWIWILWSGLGQIGTNVCTTGKWTINACRQSSETSTMGRHKKPTARSRIQGLETTLYTDKDRCAMSTCEMYPMSGLLILK